MPSVQRGELLNWWDERIFGDIIAAREEEPTVLGAAHTTMASRMKAQLVAAGDVDTLGNITNTG